MQVPAQLQQALEVSIPKTANEEEFMQIVKQCEDIGYGRMMQMIKKHWYDCLVNRGLEPETAARGAFILPSDYVGHVTRIGE